MINKNRCGRPDKYIDGQTDRHIRSAVHHWETNIKVLGINVLKSRTEKNGHELDQRVIGL